jgi:hypothetical protein
MTTKEDSFLDNTHSPKSQKKCKKQQRIYMTTTRLPKRFVSNIHIIRTGNPKSIKQEAATEKAW